MSLGRFLLRRGIQAVFVVWGVITVVFVLRFLSPTDPVTFVAPLDASEETRQAISEDLGLEEPIYQQYVDYLRGLVLQRDMGFSFRQGQEASRIVLSTLPATIELAVAASIVATVIAIPLGVIAATRRQQTADYTATTFSLVGISTPNFWLGIMLVLLIAIGGPFPTSRRPVGFIEAAKPLLTTGSVSNMILWLQHMTLPAITLGTYFTALITRLTRSGMLEELGKEYISAARAKGLPGTLVRYRYALRNTLVPVITVLGLQLGTLIGGAVITESVFNWPGLGTLLITSLENRDWPVVQGSLIVIGVGFVLINIIVDALYAYFDPRVGYE